MANSEKIFFNLKFDFFEGYMFFTEYNFWILSVSVNFYMYKILLSINCKNLQEKIIFMLGKSLRSIIAFIKKTYFI